MSGSLFYKPPQPKKANIRKKRWNIGAIVWGALKRTCMVIGAVVLFSALLSFVTLFSAMKSSAPDLPKDMILVLKLDQGIVEKADEASFADLFPMSRPTIRQLIDTLDYAARDKRIKALVVNLKAGGISLSHIQEFRAAVKRFRLSGKKAYFYSSSFADSGSGIGAYYLASAFNEIWMQPVGLLSITGFGAEIPMANSALEKVGVNPQFLQREKYKSAMESFTQKEMTPASRESWEAIIGSFAEQVFRDVSQDRTMDSLALKAQVDLGLIDGQGALDAGLIDRLDYGDVLVSEIREGVMGDPEDETLQLTSFRQYANAVAGAHKETSGVMSLSRKPKIALVYVSGTIGSTAAGANMAAADEIAPAIIDAANDESIDAIILRISSPGGSPTASETIRRAVVRAKEKGKFVAVSMGEMAASGGYWVAADADVIFANPSTLTGSIGVIMGKFEASEMWNTIGVNWETVDYGDNAGIWSMNRPFDDKQLRQLNKLIDATYQNFLERVANGRGMAIDEVRDVAQGRVWTGELAMGKGLVDQQGGLYDTLNYIAQKEGVIGPNNLEVIVMPRPKNTVEQLLNLLGGNENIVSAMVRLSDWVRVLEPYMTQLEHSARAGHYMTYDSDVEFLKQ